MCVRADTVRYALDILSTLTVIPKTQLLLAENVPVLDESGSTISTVGELFLFTLSTTFNFIQICVCAIYCMLFVLTS